MSEKVIFLIKNIVIFLILLLGVIFVMQAMGTEIDPETKEPIGDLSSVSTTVNYALALTWIGLGLIGVFTVLAIIANPKKFITSAIGIGVFAIVILIAYGMADTGASGKLALHENATESALMWGGIAIQATYILIFLAIFLILAQIVRGLLGYFAKS